MELPIISLFFVPSDICTHQALPIQDGDSAPKKQILSLVSPGPWTALTLGTGVSMFHGIQVALISQTQNFQHQVQCPCQRVDLQHTKGFNHSDMQIYSYGWW